MTIEFAPRQVKKDAFDLAVVAMPASPDLREGEVNRVKIGVSYVKDARRRGYYLTVMGESYDGTFCSHLLYADPYNRVCIESTKRFSAKRLAELAMGAPTAMLATIQTYVDQATAYYETK